MPMNSPSEAQLIDVLPVANTLGEGVLWDRESAVLWWTDIQERRLHRYQLKNRELTHFELPERLGSFGLVAGRDDLVCAFESGFAFYHPASQRLQWLQRPPHAAENVRFNDGRVDRAGRFWSGSMVEGRGEPCGQLYSLRTGRVESHLSGIAISNSICFSPEGDCLYFADTPHRTIWRFNLDSVTGALSNRQVFVTTPEGSYPDGANVDAEGHLWNAHWGAGRVVRYAPDGSISGGVELPVSQPTCVAFGGDDLDILFVTSARENLQAAVLARQPQAGHVFAYRISVKGLADSRYIP
jgi:sugar lactone lactonase YvrE